MKGGKSSFRYLCSTGALDSTQNRPPRVLDLICVTQVPPPGVAASTTPGANIAGQVTIDQQKFAASVPPFALLGRELFVGSGNNEHSYSCPRHHSVVGPGRSDICPSSDHPSERPTQWLDRNQLHYLALWPSRRGRFNVTALLFVFFPLSMSSPLLVNQAEATVFSIDANPFPYLAVVLVFAGL